MGIFRDLLGTLAFSSDGDNPSYSPAQAKMPGTLGMQRDEDDTLEACALSKRTYSQYTGEIFVGSTFCAQLTVVQCTYIASQLPKDPKVRIVEVRPSDVRRLEEAVSM